MSTIILGKDSVKDYITDGAWMQCPFGSAACQLIATPKKIQIGGKSVCTVKDNSAVVNGFDFIMCSVTQKPCKGCINLTGWQNYKADLEIDGANALSESSVIPCALGGLISFARSGQRGANKVTNGAERAKSEHGDACEEKANLQIAKVSFGSGYDICSDDYGVIWEKKDKGGNVREVKNQTESDYIKTYVLEDEGEYYHWLNKRTNPLDSVKFKPELLPVTFSGIEPVIIKAVLRTVSEKKFERIPQIRVKHRAADSDRYEFETVSVAKKGEDSYEAVIRSTNWPFEDRIACIDKFELLFEYSEDGQQWLKAGTIRNRLYITWREPLHSKFLNKKTIISSDNMQISSTKTRKPLLFESLLWLGCTNAPDGKLLSEDEDSLVRSIFAPFESKKVIRAREGTAYLNIDWSKEGLGYWRGISTAGNPIRNINDPKSQMFYDKIKNEHIPRGIRTLLSYGEARCGEWSNFFLHLLLTQGINVDENKDRCAICTDYAITDAGYDSSKYQYRKLPHDTGKKSIYFAVKDAVIMKDRSIKGKSHGQGNKDAQSYFIDHVWVYFKEKFFLDPSYGKKYFKDDSDLKEYCKDNISSMVIEKMYKDRASNATSSEVVYNELEKYMVCTQAKPVK